VGELEEEEVAWVEEEVEEVGEVVAEEVVVEGEVVGHFKSIVGGTPAVPPLQFRALPYEVHLLSKAESPVGSLASPASFPKPCFSATSILVPSFTSGSKCDP